MSAAFTTTIMCDRCGCWDENLTLNGTATRAASASVARMGCRDAGWWCGPDGDICPKCLPAAKGKPPTTEQPIRSVFATPPEGKGNVMAEFVPVDMAAPGVSTDDIQLCIISSLVVARERPLTDDERSMVSDCAMFLAAGSMIVAGMEVEAAIELVEKLVDGGADIAMSWDGETLEVSINKDDGSEPPDGTEGS